MVVQLLPFMVSLLFKLLKIFQVASLRLHERKGAVSAVLPVKLVKLVTHIS